MSTGKKYALLIGINKYPAGKWDSLDNPVTDVENIRRAIERYGYDNPIILADGQATTDNIKKELANLSIIAALEDDVFIFYAGHGERNPQTTKMELVPYDYNKGKDHVITGDQIAEYIDGMAANNVLLALDSCFSGSIHSRLNAVTEDEEYMPIEGAASRHALTSGGEERVKDGSKGSPFSNAFADCLNGNTESVLSTTDVHAYIYQELKNGRYDQKPELRHLSVKSHKSGMFSFYLDESNRISHSGEIQKLMPQAPIEAEYIPRTVTPYQKSDDLSDLFRTDRPVRTLLKIVQHNNFVVLIGIAGAGKSYELQYVRHRLWQEGRFLSIDVILDNYTGEKIDKYLPENWRHLRHDRVVLYMDGFDEIPVDKFPDAIRELNDFRLRNPTVKIILSCRTNFYNLPYDKYEGTFTGVKLVALDDIDTYVMSAYVNKHIPGDNGNFVRELRLNSFDDIAGKAYYFKPLFTYYQKHGDLKISRSDFFRGIIDDAIDENVSKYQATARVTLNPAKMREILRRLAHMMARLGKRVLTDDEVYHTILNADDQKVLPYLPFLERSSAEKMWRFEHNNIQELLSAQVLANLPAEEILNRIVVKDVGMVAQYWMNTLSFAITLAKDSTRQALLDWLMENDPEIMIRFERERLSPDLREKIACQVFNNYTNQNIWLASNRFNEMDLVRFGCTPGFTKLLLETLENPDLSPNVYGNVFRILQYYPKSAMENEKERWKTALYTFLRTHVSQEYLMYEALYRIADLFKEDTRLIDDCVALLSKHKNGYIRAGLYHLIIEGDRVDHYLGLIKEGLNLDEVEGIEDRTTVNIGSENENLLRAIRSLKHPESIKSLLSFLTTRKQGGYTSGADMADVIEAICNAAEKLSGLDSSLVKSVTDFFLKKYAHLQLNKYTYLSTLYQNTGTALDTIKYILGKPTDNNNWIIPDLLKLLLDNDQSLGDLNSAYNTGEVGPDDIVKIHEYLKYDTWREQVSALVKFESIFGESGVIQPVIDQTENAPLTLTQQLKSRIVNVFDTEGLKECFARIYSGLGTGEKSIEEVMEQVRKYPEYSSLTREVLSHLYYTHNIPDLQELGIWLDESPEFAILRLRELHTILNQDKQDVLILNNEQKSIVAAWLNTVAEKADLKMVIMDGSFNDQVMWYFINKFDIAVSERMLLAFTVYGQYTYMNATPEVLITLEEQLPEEVLKEQIIANVNDTTLSYSRWLPNVMYALRKNIKEAFPVVRKIIVESEKYLNFTHELLDYWLTQTGDTSFLDELMRDGKNPEIRLSAASMLLENEANKLGTVKYLEQRLSDDAVPAYEKMRIATELVEWNSTTGLSYFVEEIVSGREDSLGKTGNLKKVTNPDMIPHLLRLLAYASESNGINDRREHMVGDINTALTIIGEQSHADYLILKQQIESFLAENEERVPELSILRVVLLRIKESKTKDFDDFNIDDFDRDFKTHTFSGGK